ncbi:Uncharacterized protein conserved in bacteria [Raoultella terrigena]|uniref:Uncharacterized protein conserved in bacteria n=1 Tax=Raoultella terrigena TaxID=577 RepID=A0A3P8M2W5_RAOTE|nr:Uncharacterized protein conserved in bacteria [Raoultella terrigena]
MNLFGEMLHRFFGLYADVHLFNQLTLVLQPTGKTTAMERESQPARTGLTKDLAKRSGGLTFIASASFSNRTALMGLCWVLRINRPAIRCVFARGRGWAFRQVNCVP